MLTKLFEAGVDVFRLNMSHGSHDEIAKRHAIIREIEQASGRPIGILADLQGPKLRVGRFAGGSVMLERRATRPGCSFRIRRSSRHSNPAPACWSMTARSG
jgi:pyruvate kinase